MLSEPTISIVLPTRGRASLVGRLLDSILDTAARPDLLQVVLGPLHVHTPDHVLEPVPYLLLEARSTPAVTAYRRALLPINPGSAAEIDKNSRPWRLKYVRFRGPLEYIREEQYEKDYGSTDPPLGRIHRGRLRIGEGDETVRVWME